MSETPDWIDIKRNKKITNTPSCEIVEVSTLMINSNTNEIPTNRDRNLLFPWKGFDKQDGKIRFFRDVPNYFGIRRRFGRSSKSFTRYKLLRMAWKSDVTNPDGFARYDCVFLNIEDQDGFEVFVNGWNNSTKEDISRSIWNRLEELDRISL